MTRPTWGQRWRGRGGGAELRRLAWAPGPTHRFWAVAIRLERLLLSSPPPAAVGASQVAAVLFWTPITLFQFTANYATTFVAQYSGAGQTGRVGPVVWQGLYVAVLGGVAFLGLLPLVGGIVGLAGHAEGLQE